MNAMDIDFFHDLLRERRESLLEWLSEASLVEPSSAAELNSLQEALHRIEENGEIPCASCHGHVEHEVLLGSPTSNLCLECMKETDIRRLEDDLRVAREDRSISSAATHPVQRDFRLRRSLSAFTDPERRFL